MSKRLEPIEKVSNTLASLVQKEYDKWSAGVNNQYLEVEKIVSDMIDCYQDNKRLSNDNWELKKYNERLLNDNSKLSYAKQKIKEELDDVKKQLDKFYNGEMDAESVLAIINEILHD